MQSQFGSESVLPIFVLSSCVSTIVFIVLVINCLDWRKLNIFSRFKFGRLNEGSHNSVEQTIPSFPQYFNPDSKVAFDILPEIEVNIPGSENNIIEKSLKPKIYTEKSLQHVDIEKEINNLLTTINSKYYVDRTLIQPGNVIGKGSYGEVTLATMKDKNIFIQCVLVPLSDVNINPMGKLNYWKETSAYREIRHKNILTFLRINSEEAPYWSMLEFCHLGDLKSYLIAHNVAKESLFQKGLLVKFALDVASGLDVLHDHKYVHRDLAARNCLVTSDFTVKIGDYGLAEAKFPGDYFKWHDYMIPVRWMAPESGTFDGSVFKLRKLTKVANIWSLGILMSELVSFGEQPYSDLRDEELLQQVNQNVLKLHPTIALQSDKLSQIKRTCLTNASKRPTLQTIITQLSTIIDEKSPTTVNVLKLNETLSNSGSPCEFVDADDPFVGESVINDNFSFNAITLSIEPASDDLGSDDFETEVGKKQIPFNVNPVVINEGGIVVKDKNSVQIENIETVVEMDDSTKTYYEKLTTKNQKSVTPSDRHNVNIKNDDHILETPPQNNNVKKLIEAPRVQISDIYDNEVDKLFYDRDNNKDWPASGGARGGQQVITIPPYDIHSSEQGSENSGDENSGRSSKLSAASKIVNVDEKSLDDNNSKLLLKTMEETVRYFSPDTVEEEELGLNVHESRVNDFGLNDGKVDVKDLNREEDSNDRNDSKNDEKNLIDEKDPFVIRNNLNTGKNSIDEKDLSDKKNGQNLTDKNDSDDKNEADDEKANLNFVDNFTDVGITLMVDDNDDFIRSTIKENKDSLTTSHVHDDDDEDDDDEDDEKEEEEEEDDIDDSNINEKADKVVESDNTKVSYDREAIALADVDHADVEPKKININELIDIHDDDFCAKPYSMVETNDTSAKSNLDLFDIFALPNDGDDVSKITDPKGLNDAKEGD